MGSGGRIQSKISEHIKFSSVKLRIKDIGSEVRSVAPSAVFNLSSGRIPLILLWN